MSVVIVSAQTHCRGEEVAQKAAQRLGFPCLGREILEAAAKQYGVPLARLGRSIRETRSWRRLPEPERRANLAYIEAALWEYLLEDDLLCHGLAAHLYISGVSHVLRVRLTAPLEDRVRLRAETEGLAEAKARRLLLAQDKLRQEWVGSLFRVFEDDPELYDLVLDLGRIDPEGAAAQIAELAGRRRFQAMNYSRQVARNRALAARVRAALMPLAPGALIRAEEGKVHLQATSLKGKRDTAALLQEKALAVEGVREVEVQVVQDFIGQAAASLR